LKGSVRYM